MTYQDERITQAKQKIGSEMMQLTFYVIVISFLVKTLYFHYELKQCIVEFLIMVLLPIYQSIRCHQLGVVLSAFPKPTLKNTLPSILTGVFVLAIYAFAIAQKPDKASGITAIIAFCLAFFTARFGLYHLEKRRKEKLENKYDE